MAQSQTRAASPPQFRKEERKGLDMRTNERKRDIFLVWVLILALLAIGLQAPLQAAPSADLPPRDPPTPHKPHKPQPPPSKVPVAGFIDLYVQPARTGLWAVVQWQDTAGDWHDVEGWRGALDAGYQEWGVFPAQFGKGPFRWAIYQSAGGKLLAASAPFDLPAGDKESITVSVVL